MGYDATHEGGTRICDDDCSLSAQLAASIFDGNPEAEGVVWPRLCEVSLLGALGCGKPLMKLVIEEMERPNSPYDFMVLQVSALPLIVLHNG